MAFHQKRISPVSIAVYTMEYIYLQAQWKKSYKNDTCARRVDWQIACTPEWWKRAQPDKCIQISKSFLASNVNWLSEGKRERYRALIKSVSLRFAPSERYVLSLLKMEIFAGSHCGDSYECKVSFDVRHQIRHSRSQWIFQWFAVSLIR